ncbi:TRAP transporter large permease [Paraburkholderia nemoris]|uniref:TRAP transporter large permease protein n=1 Tax=Paraburkholderia aspalathi TaxID=1324617 RepID=A0A1I7EQ78_9BURK|nr:MULTISPECIES: TRAP transporter large permease [Paraburkholderia]KPD16173.1 membrane protein [Burkholderia sp. ST111]MBK5152309.1 TRAP transporter large permease [Burkholderia sp. R-69608]MCP2090940.1 tripartite ATP-independent transporter DctM subunit [Paraburkholderia sediminicola]MBK3743431.1 TRAP transporter large permease [Paraburkholderia aspalathi]MBK3785902.1 TRAP transporter large permease [Paraburkholderia aspalathi]
MELAILSVSFLVFLVFGVPVSFALGLSCVLTYLYEGLPAATAMQSMISGMNAFSFLAVPFFIFSGELMLHGGIADRILRFAQATVGHFRGGLGMANVVACTLFGGVSGSPTADTSAMGGVVIPLMKREGYSAAYAVNVTTHSSLAGALMPTSTNMIIYAFAAQGITGTLNGHQMSGVSIGDLLFSGLLPVLWVMGFVLIAAYWQAVKFGYPRRPDGSTELQRFPGWFAVARTFLGALPGLMVIAIILFCVAKGIATATEAAAIAVAYSLVLTIVIYRTMTMKKLFHALSKAAKTTGVVLLLIGVSNMLRYQMAYLEIPDAIEHMLDGATSLPWLMLLYINIIQIFLGTFVDMAAHILITTPLFLPMAMHAGVGPVQFGIMILLNCALGLVHPPIGSVQFIGCAIGNVSIGETTKVAWPYYLAIFSAINIVTYVPMFSTWLPSLINGHPVF